MAKVNHNQSQAMQRTYVCKVSKSTCQFVHLASVGTSVHFTMVKPTSSVHWPSRPLWRLRRTRMPRSLCDFMILAVAPSCQVQVDARLTGLPLSTSIEPSAPKAGCFQPERPGHGYTRKVLTSPLKSLLVLLRTRQRKWWSKLGNCCAQLNSQVCPVQRFFRSSLGVVLRHPTPKRCCAPQSSSFEARPLGAPRLDSATWAEKWVAQDLNANLCGKYIINPYKPQTKR